VRWRGWSLAAYPHRASPTVALSRYFIGLLSLVVEPRLTRATRWQVNADPSEIDGLKYSRLSATAGPQGHSPRGWEVDGVEIPHCDTLLPTAL